MRLLNAAVALVVFLLALPLFVAIMLLIKLTDTGPVFYKGTRLGLHKRPFVILKFRTLVLEAENVIGAALLNERHKVVTPVGGFLRDTRLDELPQLLNVIKGDMDLVGPRPERPEIYEHICSNIPGYDVRFAVRPGLIGYAQLYTPHDCPKRLRALIDRFYVSRSPAKLSQFFLFFYALGLLSRKALRCIWQFLTTPKRYVHASTCERRELRRVRLSNGKAYIRPIDTETDSAEKVCSLIDLNKEAILVRCNDIPAFGVLEVRLERIAPHRRGGAPKRRIARCEGRFLHARGSAANNVGVECVLEIDPVSPLNEFKLSQYFLEGSAL